MTEAWDRSPPLRLLPAQARIEVLDQTRLPIDHVHVSLDTLSDCALAISSMLVRGAPLIGLTGAGGLAVAVSSDPGDAALTRAVELLAGTRPTAVNLRWALERMRDRLLVAPVPERRALAWQLAGALQTAEHACCEAIGVHGAGLIRDAWRNERVAARGCVNILTHCNAGWLATGAWGTALAPVYRAWRDGIPVHVWVDETRPRNQGARLTAWELREAGIPHTLVVDNAAGHLMQRGEVDICFVGSDRTTASGDVCNKIGTYQKALAAADNRIPFHVALPVSTIDWSIDDGIDGIPIESRSEDEILLQEGMSDCGTVHLIRQSPPGTRAANPAFDVTPARLVSSLVCEHGVFPASTDALAPLRAMAVHGRAAL
jgi:methylthioribose-1-phosphate isomerase